MSHNDMTAFHVDHETLLPEIAAAHDFELRSRFQLMYSFTEARAVFA